MALFVNSAVIAAPQDAVFDYVADRANELEWNPQCTSVERVTDTPIGVGSRWRAQWKGSPKVEVETTHYERPHTMSNHSDGALEMTMTFTCTEAPHGGTRLDIAAYALPHGAMKVVFPLMARRFRHLFAENVERIREHVEAA